MDLHPEFAQNFKDFMKKKSAERFSEPKIWIVMQLVKLCTKFGETKKQCKYSNALLFRIHSFLD